MSEENVLNIYLVRHALSAANLSKQVNASLPDHAVPLADDVGRQQAESAGQFLAEQLRKSGGRTRVLVSPYKRTRQTADEISRCLDSAGVGHDVREEIALREISFGLFDGVPDDELESKFPAEYAHYRKHMAKETQTPGGKPYSPGEFWARMPMGESRAEVADRVKQTFGTILRDNSRDQSNPVRNFVVVSHGVTLRAFVMQWMHHPYEWYGRQTNPANASVQLISSHADWGGNPRAVKTMREYGGARYAHSTVFPGYSHVRAAQQAREEGVVG